MKAMSTKTKRIINVHNNSAVILIADDDPEDRLLMTDAFEQAEFTSKIYSVTDGVELLDYLNGKKNYKDRDEYPLPHLILLDLHMPRMDGYEALKNIRENSLFDYIHFLILTTSSSREDVLESYKLKADRFLTKPSNQSGIKKIIREMERFWFEAN